LRCDASPSGLPDRSCAIAFLDITGGRRLSAFPLSRLGASLSQARALCTTSDLRWALLFWPGWSVRCVLGLRPFGGVVGGGGGALKAIRSDQMAAAALGFKRRALNSPRPISVTLALARGQPLLVLFNVWRRNGRTSRSLELVAIAESSAARARWSGGLFGWRCCSRYCLGSSRRLRIYKTFASGGAARHQLLHFARKACMAR